MVPDILFVLCFAVMDVPFGRDIGDGNGDMAAAGLDRLTVLA